MLKEPQLITGDDALERACLIIELYWEGYCRGTHTWEDQPSFLVGGLIIKVSTLRNSYFIDKKYRAETPACDFVKEFYSPNHLRSFIKDSKIFYGRLSV